MENLDKFYGSDTIPTRLQSIIKAQEEYGAVTDGFEAWNPEEWEDQDPAHEWFGKIPSQRLITIGKDGAGSLYVLWCYEGKAPAEAPVCYLGGEGEGNTVLADNLEDFWEMLLTGESWGPYDSEFFPPETSEFDEEDPEGPAYFRHNHRKDRKEPRPAAEIREQAIKRHPDFNEFVNKEVG